MQPPENAQLHEGDFATYWFDDEGILHSRSKSTLRTRENAERNFDLIRKISGGKKVCLLVYLAFTKKPDKETREYMVQGMPSVYKAMAIVSKFGLGNFVMALLFKFQKPVIPMKTFSDEAEAKEWLRQYL
jgi:hypothetical protein